MNCPLCGGPGYTGLIAFDCDTRKCPNYRTKPKSARSPYAEPVRLLGDPWALVDFDSGAIEWCQNFEGLSVGDRCFANPYTRGCVARRAGRANGTIVQMAATDPGPLLAAHPSAVP